jgi:hypothetical protein
MRTRRWLVPVITAFILVVCLPRSAPATSLIRAGLDDLAALNETIVVGKVLDASSYWNQDGTFILTDVWIVAQEVLKGNLLQGEEFTVTLMGGTVGDLTTVIVAGAELNPERSYVLFVSDGDLPGARGVPTVVHHAQGVFDLVAAPDGTRAVSQAIRHPLVPDTRGRIEPPGGAEGLPLAAMMETLRELADRPRIPREEVK